MRFLFPVIALLCLALDPACAGEAATSLADLQGVWAHTPADCKRDLAGEWQRGEIDRVTATSYSKIGICRDGVEMLFQPQHCTATSVSATSSGLEVRGPCRVKGSHLKARFTIKHTPFGISFNMKDFDAGYFWIEGDYVRCSKSYSCTEPLNP